MNKLIVGATLALSLFATETVEASNPSVVEMSRELAVSSELYCATHEGNIDELDELATNLALGTGVNVFDALLQSYEELLEPQEIDQVAKAYRKAFTGKQLQALYAFYQSPIGQSIAAKSEDLTFAALELLEASGFDAFFEAVDLGAMLNRAKRRLPETSSLHYQGLPFDVMAHYVVLYAVIDEIEEELMDDQQISEAFRNTLSRVIEQQLAPQFGILKLQINALYEENYSAEELAALRAFFLHGEGKDLAAGYRKLIQQAFSEELDVDFSAAEIEAFIDNANALLGDELDLREYLSVEEGEIVCQVVIDGVSHIYVTQF